MKSSLLPAIVIWLALSAPAFAICGGAGHLCNALPRGTPPQLLGYNSSDIVTAITLGGDCTLSATSDTTYSINCSLASVLTTLGDLLYENSTPAPARLPGNTSTTKQFLTQTGTGSVSAAPVWGAISCADLPALTGDTTSSAGSCATTTSAVQNNSLVPARVTTSGATLSVSLSSSLNQFITLHDSITLSFSAAPSDGNVVRFKLTQSNGGSHTVTWPASVKWPGGTAPTLTTTNGQADFVQCLYDGTTTNYDCSSVLNFTP